MAGDGDHGTGAGQNFFDGMADKAVLAQRIDQANFYGGPPRSGEDAASPVFSLPPNASAFTNRGPQLAQASAAVESKRTAGSPAVVIVSGLRGVGKTAMVVEWAFRWRALFPDGVLYRDLGGLGHRDTAGLRESVIALLRQVRVSGEGLPSSDRDLLEVYRSRLADRKVLLVFDNVQYPRLVERLIPPSEHSVVFVLTDRDPAPLAGLYDAKVIPLSALSEESSLDLLRSLVDPVRVDREIDGARAIVGVCGGWPIAIRMAAGRLKTRPGLRLADLAARLQAAHQDPYPTREEEWAMQIVGDDVYAEMPAESQRAFRLLGLHPGPNDWPALSAGRGTGGSVSFGIEAAAALLGTDESAAVTLVDSLIDLHLVDEHDGRYSMHDLVRAHARRRAEREEDAEDRDAAVRRVIECYLRSAVLADLAVNPHRPTSGPVYQRTAESPYGTAKRGLAWLEAEHRNLCAMVHAAADRGWKDLAWQLCEAMWGYFLSRKQYDLWIATHQVGLRAARELDDPEAMFRMGIQLARGQYETGSFAEAHRVLDETLQVVKRTAQEPLNRATVLEFKGRAHLDAGEPAIALGFFRRAKDLEQAHGRVRGVAINLHHLGRTHLELGDYGLAGAALVRARDLFTEVPDAYNEGRVLVTLGELHLRNDRREEAAGAFDRALQIMRDEGRTYQIAVVTEFLAELAESAGDHDRAGELRAAAIAAYEHVGSIKALRLREKYSGDASAGSA